jgi:predicted RNase H-like HicB family nuclease
MNIKILLEKKEDNSYMASVPALKNCQSKGKTREEALDGISAVIQSYFESKFDEIENAGTGEIIELSI